MRTIRHPAFIACLAAALTNQPLTAKEPDPHPPVPAGNPGEWVTSGDYPSSALRESRQGTVGFELAIDPQGNVTGCVVRESSGVPVLDEATCQLVQLRAKFRPATDGRGKPVPSTYHNRVRWTLPDDEPGPPIEPFNMTVSYIVAKDGTVSDCSVTGSENVPDELVSQPPPECTRGLSEPYRDDQGNPVQRRVTIELRTTVSPDE